MVFVIVRISMMPKRSAIYWLAQPSFLKYPGLSARDGTTNCELGPPTPTFKPMFSVKAPSSKIFPAYVKLINTNINVLRSFVRNRRLFCGNNIGAIMNIDMCL